MIDAVRGGDDEPVPRAELPAAPAPQTDDPPAASAQSVRLARSAATPQRVSATSPAASPTTPDAGASRTSVSELPSALGGPPLATVARSTGSAAPQLDLETSPLPTGAARGALARLGVAARRVARDAAPPDTGRPHLTLVSSDGAPAPAPRLQRSAAERIAEQTGGRVESGEGGLRTVHFPSPGATASPLPITTQQPYTITRELTEGGTSAPATTTTTSETSDAAATASSGDSAANKAAEREELYEYFLDRFKRDLLAEREQSGYLIIDNP
jgi:hypothetical protein